MFDNGLSVNTLSGVIGIITKSMKFAVIEKDLPFSPVVDIHIPKNRTPAVKETATNPNVALPKDCIKKVFERFPEGTSSYIPMMLGYKCGLRLGEAFGLIWEDIDFDNREIRIRRQVQWMPNKAKSKEERDNKVRRQPKGKSTDGGYWYFSEPKYKSFRTIDILDDSLYDLLLQAKENQEKSREYYAEHFTNYYLGKDPSGRLFISNNENALLYTW